MNWHEYFRYEDGDLYWLPREAVNKTWNTRFAGTKAGWFDDTTGYIRLQFNAKPQYAHRIIWEMFNGVILHGLHIDHINGNRTDNRIENLQLVTQHQNNQRKFDTKGYSKYRNKFKAEKKHNNKMYHLGMFGTPCGAYMAHKMFFVKSCLI